MIVLIARSKTKLEAIAEKLNEAAEVLGIQFNKGNSNILKSVPNEEILYFIKGALRGMQKYWI